MPDGFTPVSLPLFDSQISLIVSEYSLKGVNVLVHCRGKSWIVVPTVPVVDPCFFSILPSATFSNLICTPHLSLRTHPLIVSYIPYLHPQAALDALD